MNDQTRRATISEAEAAIVLDRAARLDATRGARVEIADLRDAAHEAGISLESFQDALDGMRSGRLHGCRPMLGAPLRLLKSLRAAAGSVVRAASSFSRAALLVAGVSLGGLSVGLSALGVDDVISVFGSLSIAFVVAMGLVAERRIDRGVLGFELDLVALWSGLTFVLVLGNPGDAADVVGVMGQVGAILGVMGGIFVAVPSPNPELRAPTE